MLRGKDKNKRIQQSEATTKNKGVFIRNTWDYPIASVDISI